MRHILLLALLALGCDPHQRKRQPSEPACAEGCIADGEDCVPESCGAGTWGDLPVDGATVYVDAAAPEGGDGSAEAPLRTIQPALDLAGDRGGGLVAVAAGIYAENLALADAHTDVHLAGRCRELCILDASTGEEGDAGIRIGTGLWTAEISGLTVRGAPWVGVLVGAGEVSVHDVTVLDSGYVGVGAFREGSNGTALILEDSAVVENHAVGVLAQESRTVVTLRGTSILGSLPDADGQLGYGIEVNSGADLTAEDCTIERNTGIGVIAAHEGSAILLRGSAIRHTRPNGDGLGGHGIEVEQGASVMAEDCEIAQNTTVGALAYDPGSALRLTDTVVRDTRLRGDWIGGYGVQADDGADLTIEGGEILDNVGVAVLVMAKACARLERTSLLDTRAGVLTTVGLGLAVQDAARVQAEGVRIAGTEGPGVYVTNAGTALECARCALVDNRFAGAVAIDGASLALTDSRVAGNAGDVNLGGGMGVWATPLHAGPPRVSIVGSVIEDNPVAGVWLSGDGDALLEGNSISGGAGEPLGDAARCGDAVFVTAGGRGLRLARNTLRDGRGAGLFLDGATASLGGNTWFDNAADLVSQGPGCEQAPEGWADEPADIAVLCPTWEQPTCTDAFSLDLALVDILPSPAPGRSDTKEESLP